MKEFTFITETNVRNTLRWSIELFQGYVPRLSLEKIEKAILRIDAAMLKLLPTFPPQRPARDCSLLNAPLFMLKFFTVLRSRI